MSQRTVSHDNVRAPIRGSVKVDCYLAMRMLAPAHQSNWMTRSLPLLEMPGERSLTLLHARQTSSFRSPSSGSASRRGCRRRAEELRRIENPTPNEQMVDRLDALLHEMDYNPHILELARIVRWMLAEHE